MIRTFLALLGACLITAVVAPTDGFAAVLTATFNTVNGQANGSFIFGGAAPTISFHVTGATRHRFNISYTVSDENGRVIAGPILIPAVTDGSGNANPPAVNAPASKLGYYRVDAHLDDGTILYPTGSTLGTRPPGFITYAVMNNPDARFTYPSSLTRFGLEDQLSGGPTFSTVPSSTLAYLGVRWVGDLQQQWAVVEANGPNTFSGTLPVSYWNTTASVTPTNAPWKTYGVFYFTATHTPVWAQQGRTCGISVDFCALNATAISELPNFARRYAAAAKAQYPNQDRYYQITWESWAPYGFGGSEAQLLQYYQLVYSAIHSADPAAIVVGPTMFKSSENILIHLNNAGSPPYSAVVDGTSMHPYEDWPPEFNNGFYNHTFPSTPNDIRYPDFTFVRAIHDHRNIMKGYKGFDVPLIGTRGGYHSEKFSNIPSFNRAVRADVDKGLLQQAQGNVRATLIWLGEGGNFDTLFKVADFWFPNRSPATDPGSTWGVYFNLDSGSPGSGNWGARSLGPKPSAPAYSAMTWILDGYDRSNGVVPGLTGTQRGYSFTRTVHDPSTIWALWDYATTSMASVSIPSGAYQLCDWMGNCINQTSSGTVSVAMSGNPVYIVTGRATTTPPPVNTAVPTISGTAQVGSTLTATTGTWTNSPTSFAYQWNRAGTAIVGATASTYVPVTADVGSTLTVSVVATNSGGPSSPATSAPTSAVTAVSGVPVNTSIPTISGSATVGSTLTADPGTWTNSPTSFTYTWSWEDFGSSPFHGTTFVVRSADVGHKLGVRVTATNATGSSTPPTRSALTATVR